MHPPIPIIMPIETAPSCILDATGPAPVMRCTHCNATEPVQLPMDMKQLAKKGEAFRNEHRYCTMSLPQLKRAAKDTEDALHKLYAGSPHYGPTRIKLARIQAAMKRLQNPGQ